MPRYEFSEGTSNKFWEIELKGTSFTTTYGKVGTTGQTTLKEFPSAAVAKQEYDKIIAEKIKKGYKPAGGGRGASQAPAVAPAVAAPSSGSGTPGARYFEFAEGTSRKFWEVKLDGETVTTRYGKLGTEGQTTEKELESKTLAFKEYDKLIAEKLKKGYVEKGGGATAADKRHPDLEKAINADPYDASAYAVYADWLQEQGDPRGELISLQLATETKRDAKVAKAAAALIESKADYFLGPLADHAKTYDGSDHDAFTWRFGFIHSAKLSHNQSSDADFEGSMAEVLETLLRHPSGRFLTELVFGFNSDPGDSLDDLIGILAKKAPATIRKLHFGDFEYPDDTEMSWYHVGSLGKLWKAVPQLRSLIVQGGEFELGTIELPELTRAEFRTGGLSAASAKAIAKAALPKIEHLAVWYGDKNHGGTAKVADAAALLDRTDLGRLTSLGIMNTSFTDELCGVLPVSKLLPQLTRLDLSMGIMTDEGARVLAAHKDAFKHLAELDVSHNYLTKAGVTALKGVAKSVVSTRQREDYEPEYRHPSVGE